MIDDFIQEINRLILHPLGHVLLPADVGTFKIYDLRLDGEVTLHQADSDAAQRVADGIEARGPARIAELGFVVQPLPPDTKQLHLTIKEPFTERIGPAGDYDEGEERP